MRRVHTSDMVCHLWANERQSDARNSSGSLYFRDSTIYSYGSHFPMARHNRGVVLITTRTHSVTTAKHLSMVRSAIGHLRIIPCSNVSAETTQEHQANLQAMREEFYTALDKATRARTYTQHYMDSAKDLIEHHTTYRAVFGEALDEPLVINEEWRKEAQGRVKAQATIVKERKRQATLREEQRRIELLHDLEEWKNNTNIIYRTFSGLPVALRLSEDGENVQTSQGADVPVGHALRLWKKVKAIQAGTEQPYLQNGHTEHAGVFEVQSIDAQGTLIAGCHTITFEAMREFAGKMGW